MRSHRRVLSRGPIWIHLRFWKVTVAAGWGEDWSRERLKQLGLRNQNTVVAVQARNDGDSDMGLEWHGGNRVRFKRGHPLRALCAMLRMLRFHPVGNKEPLKQCFLVDGTWAGCIRITLSASYRRSGLDPTTALPKQNLCLVEVWVCKEISRWLWGASQLENHHVKVIEQWHGSEIYVYTAHLSHHKKNWLNEGKTRDRETS